MADSSTHPMAVFRVLRNAFRRFVGVSNISMAAVGASSPAATPTVITGTVLPANAATAITMEIITDPAAVRVQVQTVPVTSAGTFTATFTLPAGTYKARITTIPPASHAAVLSNAFTKT
jgi:hypothetical protein